MMDDSVLESNAKFGKHSLAADTDGSTRDTLDMERMGKQQTLRVKFTIYFEELLDELIDDI